jgi:hypothetical protein
LNFKPYLILAIDPIFSPLIFLAFNLVFFLAGFNAFLAAMVVPPYSYFENREQRFGRHFANNRARGLRSAFWELNSATVAIESTHNATRPWKMSLGRLPTLQSACWALAKSAALKLHPQSAKWSFFNYRRVDF